MENTGSILGTLMVVGIIFAFCALVFLAIREIMTWYWKIDTIIKNQDMQNQLLRELLEEQRKKNSIVPSGSTIELQ